MSAKFLAGGQIDDYHTKQYTVVPVADVRQLGMPQQVSPTAELPEPESYKEAFYEIVRMLGLSVGAPTSPADVYQNMIRPKILRLLALEHDLPDSQTLHDGVRGETER